MKIPHPVIVKLFPDFLPSYNKLRREKIQGKVNETLRNSVNGISGVVKNLPERVLDRNSTRFSPKPVVFKKLYNISLITFIHGGA